MESLVGIIIIGVLGITFVVLYNSLIFRKNQIDQNVGSIQAYIKKRADLIPNLIAMVSEYARHEKDLLTKIVELRASSIAPNQSAEKQIQASDQLSQSMKGLMVSVENYPELKADANFRHLQQSLSDIEDQLAAARRSYSAAVVEYNNGVEMIPYNIVAAIMRLKVRPVVEGPLLPENTVDVAGTFNKQRQG